MIFKCKNCGGNMIYDPETGNMHCPFCDSDNTEEVVSEAMLGICPCCGASIDIKDFTSTCKCEHCGNYIIFNERIEGKYEPHLILPFKLSKNQVKEKLKQEFQKKVFIPESFFEESRLQSIEGMYVPFWLYDYMVHGTFEGRGTKLRVWRSGDTEYTEHKIYSIIREMNIDFEKIPVDASIEMEDHIMDLMEPYDYQALEKFQAKYMSGFFSEIYNEDSKILEERAKKKVNEDAEMIMRESMPDYQAITDVKQQIDLRNDATQYALMPVWVYEYDYKKVKYRFYINGQTGKIIGKTPIARKKVVLYGTTLFMGIVLCGKLLSLLLEVL